MSTHSQLHWRMESDADEVAWLTLDRIGSSANSLNGPVLEELADLLQQLRRSHPRGVVLLSGKASGFVAGADIGEFRSIRSPEQALPLVQRAQAILNDLESLPCPTVAAVDGFALGGGLELALACRYRIATERSTFGLPEVLLGIHPGFGGTVRAPRVLGSVAALELMLSGRTLRAEPARRAGLVDAIVPAAGLRDAVIDFMRRLPPARRAPWYESLVRLPAVRDIVASRVKRKAAARVRADHYPAPFALVELWRRQCASREDVFRAEAESIARLLCTEASRCLVRVYFLQERLKDGGRGGPDCTHMHVIGAGVMGGDIAAWSAYRGLQVTLHDRSTDQIDAAIVRAKEFLARRCRGPDHLRDCLKRLEADPAGNGCKTADVIVEAIVEDVAAKRALFVALESSARPEAILCTNTSSIPIDDIAAGLQRPERLVGLHFFNPVSRMPLVEIVRGAHCDAATATTAAAVARALDKLPLPCRSSPGFVVNRILMAYMSEALRAVQEGIAIELIDRVATDFGMPQGPIELADTVGLDVALKVGRILASAYDRPPPTALEAMVDKGALGRKSGRGFYVWRDGRPERRDARAMRAPQDLEDRLVLQFLNEAVACLREQVVADADLIDAGAVFGTGFAPFRGGPLHYARSRGIEACVIRMRELAERYGRHFEPDAGWSKLAAPDASASSP